MNRRNFIRLLGGGLVLAAAPSLTSCSSEVPPKSIAAWKGPVVSFGAPEMTWRNPPAIVREQPQRGRVFRAADAVFFVGALRAVRDGVRV